MYKLSLFKQITQKRIINSLIILLIFSISFSLRIYGINWDNGFLFHPDERQLLMLSNEMHFPKWSELSYLLNPNISPLNPQWFNYGTLPLYILEITNFFLSFFTNFDVYKLRFPARIISALFDSATVTLISIFALKYFGRKTGFFTSFFSIFCVIQLQHSHFFVVDTILTFFIVALVFICAKISKTCTLKDSIIAGILLSAALATKISSLPISILIFLSYFLYAIFPNKDDVMNRISINISNIKKALIGISICILVSLIFFFLFSPYSIIDFPKFLEHNLTQSKMIRGSSDLPYTRQYIDTIPYIYHLKQITTTSLGIVVSSLGLIGLIITLIKSRLPFPKIHVILIFWIFLYFLIFGHFQVKFSRYMLPIIPFIIIYSSIGIVYLSNQISEKYSRLAIPIISIILLLSLHYPLSFLNIYSQNHTAIEASNFLNLNAKPNSLILKEHWDEGLPNLNKFKIKELPLYNFDSTKKTLNLSLLLSESDYIVIFSNRLYGTIPRLPERYPFTSNYYQRLFDGSLGYSLIHQEKKEPKFLGIKYTNDNFSRIPISPPKTLSGKDNSLQFNLGWHDESFSVYDHPTILIFKKSQEISSEELFSILNQPIKPSELLMEPDQMDKQYSGQDRNKIIFSSGLNQISLIIIWYFFVQLLSISIIPIIIYSFRSLSDKGYILSKPIGVLINAFLVWILTSLNILNFSQSSIYLSLIILTLFSITIIFKQKDYLLKFIKSKWKLIITFEFLFLISFFIFLIIRSLNPDLWHPYRGGEKPMDFAYLNAIIRSTKMPPFDPWFSSGYLNYYYFGHFLVAYLIKATGIEPSIAYNLAIPLLFSFSVVAVVSLFWNIKPSSKIIFGKSSSKILSFISIFSVLSVLIIGNLESLFQITLKIKNFLIDKTSFGTFDYWAASRMMPSGSKGHEITEFPFFTFLFADLHAHLIVIPFMISSLSVFLAIINFKKNYSKLNLLALYGICSIIIGSIWTINTWNIPTQILLLSGVILFSELKNESKFNLRKSVYAILKIILITLFSFTLFMPFHLNFISPTIGLQLSDFQSPLLNFISIFSIPLFIFIIWISYPKNTQSDALTKSFKIFLIVLLFISIGVLIISTKYLTFIFILFLILFWIYSLKNLRTKYKNSSLSTILFFWYLGFIGLLILAGTEIITIKEDIGRMNTVFKFYLQSWILINISSSFFLGIILVLKPEKSYQKIFKSVFSITLIFLTASCFLYTIFGTHSRIQDRFTSTPLNLDGALFMEKANYKDPLGNINFEHDYLAIKWLNLNLKGSPIISEGNTPLYRWGNRISVYTGLPTIIGWDWHQTQQRKNYKKEIQIRKDDIKTIYSSPNLKISLDLLSKYNVEYIYVGKLEKLYYPIEGIEKFESLTPIYVNDEVTIFKIPKSIE